MLRAGHMPRKALGILSSHLQALLKQEGKVETAWVVKVLNTRPRSEAAVSTPHLCLWWVSQSFQGLFLGQTSFLPGQHSCHHCLPTQGDAKCQTGGFWGPQSSILGSVWLNAAQFLPEDLHGHLWKCLSSKTNTRKIILLSNLRRLRWLSRLRTQIIHPRSPKTNITKDCKVK